MLSTIFIALSLIIIAITDMLQAVMIRKNAKNHDTLKAQVFNQQRNEITDVTELRKQIDRLSARLNELEHRLELTGIGTDTAPWPLNLIERERNDEGSTTANPPSQGGIKGS